MGLLDGILGGGDTRQSGATSTMSKMALAAIGLLAYKAIKDGGLPNIFGRSDKPESGETGRRQSASSESSASSSSGGEGILGGMLGGAAGGSALAGGLGDLLKQFQQSGKSDVADSWVSTGQNKSVTPAELEQTLGPERVEWLVVQTGLPRDELLAGLCQELPVVVDRLTPEGRVPSEQEATRMM